MGATKYADSPGPGSLVCTFFRVKPPVGSQQSLLWVFGSVDSGIEENNLCCLWFLRKDWLEASTWQAVCVMPAGVPLSSVLVRLGLHHFPHWNLAGGKISIRPLQCFQALFLEGLTAI